MYLFRLLIAESVKFWVLKPVLGTIQSLRVSLTDTRSDEPWPSLASTARLLV